MTREDILAMKPGKELDALVGSIVLKLPQKYVCVVDDRSEEECCILDRPSDCLFAYGLLAKGLGRDDCKYWRRLEPEPYSTDLSAAWEVVEKMAKKWPDFGISKSNQGSKWCVSWGFDGHGWEYADAETAPLAICKAALLSALEVTP